MSIKLTEELKNSILESLNFAYALIDSEMNFISFNRIFSELFSVNKSEENTFLIDDVKFRINDVITTGNDSALNITLSNNKYYLINFTLIKDSNKKKYVLCIISESTEKTIWQKEFNLLFEKSPNYICIIDRSFKIIRSNERYRDVFGDNHSFYQTEQSKKKALETGYIPSAVAFRENEEIVSTQVGFTKTGTKCNLIVNSIPLNYSDGLVTLVMEISTDITELTNLQEQLNHVHEFYNELIENTSEGIIAVDNKGKVQIFNSAARNILGLQSSRKPSINKINDMIPEDFFKEPDLNGIIVSNKEISVKDSTGNVIPVRINAFEIKTKKNILGRVTYLNDMRLIKALEDEKIKAEKEAIITTFKSLENNTLQIFENERKALDKFEKSLHNSTKEDIEKNWVIMRNKFELTQHIVSTFIKLAKGYTPVFKKFNFEQLIDDITQLFLGIAEFDNIDFSYEKKGNLSNVLGDKDLFEILIKTLISNSLEAVTENKINPTVKVSFHNTGKYIQIDVFDNGAYLHPDILENNNKDKNLNKEFRFGMLTMSMLVKSCGGSIKAISSLSNGNTIQVVLPF
jgi:PAS domain S-box-containing protein